MTQKNKQAMEWIHRAASDLQYAQAGEEETGQHHITCFLCQQAVEKILKGLLVAVGATPERTHSLGRLATLVSTTFADIKRHVVEIRRLDKYYITARYPDDLTTEFTKADAREALHIAATVLQWARDQLAAQ